MGSNSLLAGKGLETRIISFTETEHLVKPDNSEMLLTSAVKSHKFLSKLTCGFVICIISCPKTVWHYMQVLVFYHNLENNYTTEKEKQIHTAFPGR
jgi:hypothetical protein